MAAVTMSNRDQALSSIVEKNRSRLMAFIRQQIRDQAEADDIFQDVVEELMETTDLGQAIESLGAWLVTVARNKVLDRFRRRKTQEDHRSAVLAESEGREPESAGPEDDWTRTWLRTEIVAALELLPPEQREVFVAHELEGKSFEQLAAETGVGVNTLLSRKRYAVRFLREHLKEVYDELE